MNATEASWLYMHVGHGKTGSSYLQSWLAINAPALGREHDLVYPLRSVVTGHEEDAARASRFSMGNGFVLEELLAKRRRATAPRFLRALVGGSASLVFSCERFMRSLAGRLADVEELALESGFTGVRYLLFVRDPLEHAGSLYVEMVKAHGYSASLDDWLQEYELLEHVERFLFEVDRCRDASLRVVNYSRTAGLLDHLAEWLSVEVSAPTFEQPIHARVNRSLTIPELRVQLLANAAYGRAAARIGRRLVDELPALPTVLPVASPAARAAFARRLAPRVERLNERLGEEASYRLDAPGIDAPEGDSTSPLVFTPKQLAIIVSELRAVASTSEATILRRLARRLGARILPRRDHRAGG